MARKYASITPSPAGLQFRSSFDHGLINDLKTKIPNSDKKPVYESGKFMYWLIDPKHVGILKTAVSQHLGIELRGADNVKTRSNVLTVKLVRVEYIGGLKDRGDGLTATGAILTKTNAVSSAQSLANLLAGNGSPYELDWSIIFPEAVLKGWFEGNQSRPTQTTLYSTLAISRDASQDEIKKAWRKMIHRFHPDVNKDHDAEAMTIEINKAYGVLRNPQKRKKYNAGLLLQEKTKSDDNMLLSKHWAPPLRCGMILMEGKEQVRGFVVSKILDWQDITENGRSLVTSWDSSINSLIRKWI